MAFIPERSRPAAWRGFSLIEIMVVMVFIGIMFSIATISISTANPNKQLRGVAESFITNASHFREVAIAGGLPVGIYLEPPQWQEDTSAPVWQIRWYKLEPVVVQPTEEELEQRAAVSGTASLLDAPPKVVDTWVEVEGVPDAGIIEQTLIEIKVDETVVEFGREPPEAIVPQIVFNPTGEVTQFEIILNHDDDSDLQETILIDEWGDVIWKEEAEILKEIEERQ